METPKRRFVYRDRRNTAAQVWLLVDRDGVITLNITALHHTAGAYFSSLHPESLITDGTGRMEISIGAGRVSGNRTARRPIL